MSTATWTLPIADFRADVQRPSPALCRALTDAEKAQALALHDQQPVPNPYAYSEAAFTSASRTWIDCVEAAPRHATRPDAFCAIAAFGTLDA